MGRIRLEGGRLGRRVAKSPAKTGLGTSGPES